jgi:hypothetical protein
VTEGGTMQTAPTVMMMLPAMIVLIVPGMFVIGLISYLALRKRPNET